MDNVLCQPCKAPEWRQFDNYRAPAPICDAANYSQELGCIGCAGCLEIAKKHRDHCLKHSLWSDDADRQAELWEETVSEITNNISAGWREG